MSMYAIEYKEEPEIDAMILVCSVPEVRLAVHPTATS